jgi:hypothetical protein
MEWHFFGIVLLGPGSGQGCQIFLDKIYQSGEKYTELSQCYQITIKLPNIPNDHKIYQHFSFLRMCKIYPNLDFLFENIPSGNPGLPIFNLGSAEMGT